MQLPSTKYIDKTFWAIFLMTEHMALPMQLCDKFTPLMVGLLAINVMLAYLTNGKTVEERSGDSK